MRASDTVAKRLLELKDRDAQNKALYDTFCDRVDELGKQRGTSKASVHGIAKEMNSFLTAVKKRTGLTWINPTWADYHTWGVLGL